MKRLVQYKQRYTANSSIGLLCDVDCSLRGGRFVVLFVSEQNFIEVFDEMRWNVKVWVKGAKWGFSEALHVAVSHFDTASRTKLLPSDFFFGSRRIFMTIM